MAISRREGHVEAMGMEGGGALLSGTQQRLLGAAVRQQEHGGEETRGFRSSARWHQAGSGDDKHEKLDSVRISLDYRSGHRSSHGLADPHLI